MIQLILFIAACLAWQVIRDFFGRRLDKKPTVRLMTKAEAEAAINARFDNMTLEVGELHGTAVCGCGIINKKVIKPCAAHAALRRVIND